MTAADVPVTGGVSTGPQRLLDELDEAHAAATAGPWQVDDEWIWGDVSAWGACGELVTRAADVEDKDIALIVAAVNALPALTAGLRAAEDALHLIARPECHHTTNERWRCWNNPDRVRGAQYTGDAWCDACVAADALATITAALSEDPR